MCCRYGKIDLKGKSQVWCYYDFFEENRGDIVLVLKDW